VEDDNLIEHLGINITIYRLSVGPKAHHSSFDDDQLM